MKRKSIKQTRHTSRSSAFPCLSKLIPLNWMADEPRLVSANEFSVESICYAVCQGRQAQSSSSAYDYRQRAGLGSDTVQSQKKKTDLSKSVKVVSQFKIICMLGFCSRAPRILPVVAWFVFMQFHQLCMFYAMTFS